MSSSKDNMSLDERMSAMRLIWGVMLGSVVLYAVAGVAMNPPGFSARALAHGGEDGSPAAIVASVVLYTAGLAACIFVAPRLMRSFLARAEREQRPGLVQTGLVVSLAVCEAVALAGLCVLLATGSWVALMLMAASALMIVILRPRRDQLAAAGYKIDTGSAR